jgi:hypothetical protein
MNIYFKQNLMETLEDSGDIDCLGFDDKDEAFGRKSRGCNAYCSNTDIFNVINSSINKFE